jgi:hypothetical protein
MDWCHGSSGREPALQAQSPEFKLQSHKKKNTKTTKLGVVTNTVILALKKLRWEDLEFKASLGYIASLRLPWLHSETLSQKKNKNGRCFQVSYPFTRHCPDAVI